MRTITGKINTEYLICFVLIILALLLIDAVWRLIQDYKKGGRERAIKGDASLCVVKQGNRYIVLTDGDAEECLNFAQGLTYDELHNCNINIYEEWEA